MDAWSPLTHHGQILVYLARRPDTRQAELSRLIPGDLRTVAHVVKDLVQAGVVRVEKQGRRNCYEVVLDAPLAGPLLQGWTVGDLLAGLVPVSERQRARDKGLP
jgi:hypothetical protein